MKVIYSIGFCLDPVSLSATKVSNKAYYGADWEVVYWDFKSWIITFTVKKIQLYDNKKPNIFTLKWYFGLLYIHFYSIDMEITKEKSD